MGTSLRGEQRCPRRSSPLPRLSSPSPGVRAPRDASAPARTRAHASHAGPAPLYPLPGPPSRPPAGSSHSIAPCPRRPPPPAAARRSSAAVRATDGDAALRPPAAAPRSTCPRHSRWCASRRCPWTVIFYMQGGRADLLRDLRRPGHDWSTATSRKMNLVSSFGAFLDPVADNHGGRRAGAAVHENRRRRLGAVHGGAGDDHRPRDHHDAIREWAAAAGGEARRWP